MKLGYLHTYIQYANTETTQEILNVLFIVHLVFSLTGWLVQVVEDVWIALMQEGPDGCGLLLQAP